MKLFKAALHYLYCHEVIQNAVLITSFNLEAEKDAKQYILKKK